MKSIIRSKGRNILILLIVAVIAAAASVALAIRQAAASAETSGMDNLTITGTISVDRQKLMQEAQASGAPSAGSSTGFDRGTVFQNIPQLTLDQMQSYATSSHVQDFLYSASVSLDTTGDVKAVSTESDSTDSSTSTPAPPTTESTQTNGRPQGGPQGGGPMVFNGRSMGDVQVIGYGSEASMTGFVSGAQAITEGAMIDLTKADATCLVSDEFATYNSLAVGDTITLANPSANTETYTLTIAGIFHVTSSDTSSSGNGPVFSTSQDPSNQIITSYPEVAAITTQSASVATQTTDSRGNTVSTALSSQTSGTYVFASPADYTAFQSDLTTMGLDSSYTLSSSDVENYEASLVPLKNVASFAQTLLWIVLGVGAIVLVTIAIFSIRERKYEVGVLTAIGVAKPKVALQFVVEMFVVTLIGLVVGLGIGAAASVPVANNLLSTQVASQQAQAQTVDQNFGRGGGPQAGGMANPSGGPTSGFGRATEYISQINATIDWSVVGQMAAIGLGLAIIASAVGVIFVLRYEPLTILANRS